MITIACTCSDSYTSYMKSLIKSVDANTNNVDHFFIRLVNSDTTIPTTTEVTVVNDNKHFKFDYEEVCYTSNIRFDTIIKCLEHHDHILYMDVDMIVRGNIQKLEDLILDNDLVFCQTQDSPDYTCYQPGMIGIRKSDKIIDFFSSVDTEIKKDMLEYDIDEEIIYEELKESNLKIGKIPGDYKDKHLNDDSIIWSGHHYSKRSTRYRAEMVKY